MGHNGPNRKAGMIERQILTWQNTGDRFQSLIITWTKTVLGAKFAHQR